jgi:hypothetical protein
LSRALLRQHGYGVPTGGAETFARRVVALGLPGRLLSAVGPLLALMRTVNAQLAYCEARSSTSVSGIRGCGGCGRPPTSGR